MKRRRTTKPTDPFVRIPHSLFDSAEYRGLRPLSRDVLHLLIRRYNGRNNGQISLGAREAADWFGYGKTVANEAFRELEQAKLIAAVRRGHMVPEPGRKNVSTIWRIAFLKDADAHE